MFAFLLGAYIGVALVFLFAGIADMMDVGSDNVLLDLGIYLLMAALWPLVLLAVAIHSCRD
jgi:hypothetical protein